MSHVSSFYLNFILSHIYINFFFHHLPLPRAYPVSLTASMYPWVLGSLIVLLFSVLVDITSSNKALVYKKKTKDKTIPFKEQCYYRNNMAVFVNCNSIIGKLRDCYQISNYHRICTETFLFLVCFSFQYPLLHHCHPQLAAKVLLLSRLPYLHVPYNNSPLGSLLCQI